MHFLFLHIHRENANTSFFLLFLDCNIICFHTLAQKPRNKLRVTKLSRAKCVFFKTKIIFSFFISFPRNSTLDRTPRTALN